MKKGKQLPPPTPIDVTPNLRLQIVAEYDLQLTNVLERLGNFYFHHLYKGESDSPIGRILNPEHAGVRIHSNDDVWLLLFRKGYRVHIIKHYRYITGPHAARLYYQSYQTRDMYWIATLQIGDIMFYNEPAIVEELRRLIVLQDFFIAPHSYKDKVAL